jgi:FkbM family methyltransferase
MAKPGSPAPDTGGGVRTVPADTAPRFHNCFCTTFRHGRVVFPLADTFLHDALVLCGDYSLGEQIVYGRIVRPGATVLDIGANIGLMSLLFARLTGSGGRTLAFEPSGFAFGLLRENLRMNGVGNVRASRAIVSDLVGESSFVDPDIEDIDRLDFGQFSVGHDGRRPPGRMIPTPRLTIDSLDLERCHLIKVDVEGHESAVIRGAMATIRRHRPCLSIEAWDARSDLGWIDAVTPLGYRVFLMPARVITWPNFKQHDSGALSTAITVQAICLPVGMAADRILDRVPHEEMRNAEELRARLATLGGTGS